MSNDYVKVQRRSLMEILTCPLCLNLYREATTICICLHTFCKQCIYQKLEKDKRNHCPVCNAYLGSFPEELLRNDHNLRELVTQIFRPEKTSEQEKSPAFPVKTKIAEATTPTLIEANRYQEFSMSKVIHDDRDAAGSNLLLNQTPNKILNQTPNKILNHSLDAIKNQKGPCWEHLAGHEEGKTYKSILNKTKVNAQVKRRRTKRKPCKFLAGKRVDGSKIGTEREMSKPGPSGVGRSIDSANPCGETVSLKELPAYSTRPVWFCLLACQEKKRMALPQLPKPFISTKNGDIDVSFVNKYLARKLNLRHEYEVEVMCLGHPLVPTLTLNKLIDIWLEAVSDMGPVSVNCNAENGNGGNFVMELTYRRAKNQCDLQ